MYQHAKVVLIKKFHFITANSFIVTLTLQYLNLCTYISNKYTVYKLATLKVFTGRIRYPLFSIPVSCHTPMYIKTNYFTYNA